MTAKPPWCGHCDRRTRLIVIRPDPDDPSQDRAVRCEECHPLAQDDTCPHFRPRGICVLCQFPDRETPPASVTRERADRIRQILASS